jgi:putative tricarboxylic transport membrane protein
MSQEAAPPQRPAARVDLASALVWIAVGGTVVAASWTMDRLEARGALAYNAPGLVPGVLGLVLTLLGIVLGARALRQGALVPGAVGLTPALRAGWGGIGAVLALCLAYAAGAVGRAPFWLATFVFVSVFIAIYEYPLRRERDQGLRGVVLALVYGAVTSAVVTLAFEKIFLVRLP